MGSLLLVLYYFTGICGIHASCLGLCLLHKAWSKPFLACFVLDLLAISFSLKVQPRFWKKRREVSKKQGFPKAWILIGMSIISPWTSSKKRVPAVFASMLWVGDFEDCGLSLKMRKLFEMAKWQVFMGKMMRKPIQLGISSSWGDPLIGDMIVGHARTWICFWSPLRYSNMACWEIPCKLRFQASKIIHQWWIFQLDTVDYWRVPYFSEPPLCQWPFQAPKSEVPTIYKAYFLGLCKRISPQKYGLTWYYGTNVPPI